MQSTGLHPPLRLEYKLFWSFAQPVKKRVPGSGTMHRRAVTRSKIRIPLAPALVL